MNKFEKTCAGCAAVFLFAVAFSRWAIKNKISCISEEPLSTKVSINDEDSKNVELKEDGNLVVYKNAIVSNVNGTIVYRAPMGFTYIGDGICVKTLGKVGESVSIITEGQCEIIVDPIKDENGKYVGPTDFVLGSDGKLHKIVFVNVDYGFLVHENGVITEVIPAPREYVLLRQNGLK